MVGLRPAAQTPINEPGSRKKLKGDGSMGIEFTRTGFRAALLAGCAMAALPTAAHGQEAEAPEAGQPTETEIVVTGSRIARKDYTSNSPIVSIGAEQLKATNSVTMDDVLFRLPEVTPAFGQGSNDTTTSGVTTIGLRGLGAPRTLVLLDGRRLTAATYTGAVDLNIIPKSLIESVEVITGGASAAYGSDAVAGVVNFRLKKNFTGIQVSAQAGITERGDGATQEVSFTAGSGFADGRGNAVLTLEWMNRDGVNNRDRAFSAVSRPSSSLPFGAFNPNAANLPSQSAVDAVFSRYGIASGSARATGNLAFNTNGTLFAPTGSFNYLGGAQDMLSIGGNSFYNSSGVNGLTIPFERYGVFGKVDYEVRDGLTVYAHAGYQHVTSGTVFAPGFATVTVPIANPFIPADLRQILASRPNPNASFTVTKRFADVGARTASSTTNGYTLMAGVKGDLAFIDGGFDIYVSRGQQTANQHDENGVSLSALNSLINAADGGAAACGGYNIFGNQPSGRCATYIRRNTLRVTEASQDMVEASIQGRLFKLPAGDVRFALGADYRKDSFDFTPDSGLASGDVVSFATGAIPAVSGSTNVKEVFGEILVPVLRGLPLIQELNLSAGYRYSDYNTSGGISTYRFEGDWRMTDWLRLRGGYARAARAPNVYELYSPQTPTAPVVGAPGIVGQGDPCDIRGAYRTGASASQVRSLCLAQGVPANIVDSYIFTNTQLTDGALTGGNPNLTPEKADTYTIGAVLQPKLAGGPISRLSFSVDYYHISLKDAIGTLDGANALRRCYNIGGYNSQYATDNPYCALFRRDPATGQINGVSTFNLNLGRIVTSGIDATLQTRFDIGEDKLDLTATLNWTEQYTTTNLPGDTPTNLAGSIGSSAGSSAGVSAAFPKWKGVVNLSYSTGAFQFGGQWRYLSKMRDVSAIGVANSTAIGTPAYHYFDLNAEWRVNKSFAMRLGMVNLTDKQPPVYTSFYQSNTYPGVYDVLGRSFFVGATANF